SRRRSLPYGRHTPAGPSRRPRDGPMLDRRKLLAGAAALGLAPMSARGATAFEWQTVAPDEAGFAPGFAARLDQVIVDWKRNIHCVIVARRGRIAFEKYYEGDDVVWNAGRRPELARIVSTAERSHDIRSVTKSIVSLLYGIALNEGKVPPVDTPLLAQFPQ